jgi:hypothetical protein
VLFPTPLCFLWILFLFPLDSTHHLPCGGLFLKPWGNIRFPLQSIVVFCFGLVWFWGGCWGLNSRAYTLSHSTSPFL